MRRKTAANVWTVRTEIAAEPKKRRDMGMRNGATAEKTGGIWYAERMKQERIGAEFFTGMTTLQAAKELLGCLLTVKVDDTTVIGRIIETEAYSQDDAASHSFGGRKTNKNSVMFKSAGHLYVYFTYGMHYCMNIVTEREGRGCAVLIRAVEPVEGIEIMRGNRHAASGKKIQDRDLTNGPAKVCQAFGIHKEHNGSDLTNRNSLIHLIRRTGTVPKHTRTPRIGISREKEKLWRFVTI